MFPISCSISSSNVCNLGVVYSYVRSAVFGNGISYPVRVLTLTYPAFSSFNIHFAVQVYLSFGSINLTSPL
ncbi:hypothetical protein Mgra_00000436 [Meloidogyne graminicola]|uniref:Uncharacterized protein n=1 Tax=Meloidogyne graminicola TaxID=189291 RepID=A0A8T0A4Z0_9BILA|nr:hypothetical protein Mgra_00000436 [Meloidogyne graminicola]